MKHALIGLAWGIICAATMNGILSLIVAILGAIISSYLLSWYEDRVAMRKMLDIRTIPDSDNENNDANL